MKNSFNLIIAGLFFLTFIIHFGVWKFALHLDEVVIIKFYLFLTVIFMFLITVILIINKIIPQFLGLCMIGLVLLKFGMMYMVWKKLNFVEVPNYKIHFILPYFVLTALLTYYAIRLINYDKKQ